MAIGVETGTYALDETALAASRRLQAQRPSAEVWFVRVGHRALHHIGAGVVGQKMLRVLGRSERQHWAMSA